MYYNSFNLPRPPFLVNNIEDRLLGKTSTPANCVKGPVVVIENIFNPVNLAMI